MHNHRLMALWAAECAEHALSAFWTADNDQRPFYAVQQARAWARGEISVGDARQAAVAAHAAARASKAAAALAAARAAGHAAATAHMADHCLGAAAYALKAADKGGMNTAQERQWQDKHLPVSIRKLVISARALRRI
ncbi:MAG: putative immunity protein [bacterium]